MKHICPHCHKQIEHLDVDVEATGMAKFYLSETQNDDGELETFGIEWDIDIIGYECPNCHHSIKPGDTADKNDPDYVEPPCEHDSTADIKYIDGSVITRCTECHQTVEFVKGDVRMAAAK